MTIYFWLALVTEHIFTALEVLFEVVYFINLAVAGASGLVKVCLAFCV